MRISDWSSDVCSSDLRAAAVVILCSSVAAAQAADQVAPVADTWRSVEAHEAALPANAGAVEPAQQTAVADATAKAAAYVPKTAYDNSPYRFNAGKRFTAAEFDAWMKSRGIRVAKGNPAAGSAAAAATETPAATTNASDSNACNAQAVSAC